MILNISLVLIITLIIKVTRSDQEMLEADVGVGVLFGISCGFCLGWVLRGRYSGKIASVKNLADKVSV